MKGRRQQAPTLGAKLDDPTAERVRHSHEVAIKELQGRPAAGLRVVRGIPLVDGADTRVPHGLGRPPLWVKESAVRGAVATGRVVDRTAQTAEDPSKFVVLQATGWGATITVDVLVL